MDNSETIEGILAAMRAGEVPHHRRDQELLAYLADRIEAAAVRERSKLERERRSYEKLHDCFWDKNAIQNIVRQMLGARDDLRRVSPNEADNLQYFVHELMRAARSAIGNAARLREALVEAYALLAGQSNGGTAFARGCARMCEKIDAALSKAARNCDVGMPAEQAERMFAFCSAKGGCPCDFGKGKSFRECVLAWAQESCEAKEGGAGR